jgi:hypothetical protein
MMAVFDGRNVADQDVEDYLSRQRTFDPDLWIVEVEAPGGRHLLDDWILTSSSSRN